MKSAEELVAYARAQGVDVRLSQDGSSLEILSQDRPPLHVLALLKPAKLEILAILQMERRQVDHWVKAHIVNWPQEMCFHCRKRVLVGQAWVDVTSDSARARFHKECLPAWRADMEVRARRTIGLPQPTHEFGKEVGHGPAS